VRCRSHPFLKLLIYMMNADGTGQTNLTNNPGFNSYVYWTR
jgi:hypothetical protein